MNPVILLPLVLGLCSSSPILVERERPQEEMGLSLLRREARTLEPLVNSKLARDFLLATDSLPAIAPRKLFLDEVKKAYLTEAEAGSLTREARGTLKQVPVNEALYYTTKYGSPLAYARPLDLLGQSGLEDVSGMKIFDFGYGTVGHLRLLAGLGADVTGLDVNPLLRRPLWRFPKIKGRSRAGAAGTDGFA